jgi:hypothetical protein
MGKFFTVTKKIEVAASKQHAAFGAGEVVTDWTAIQVPRGASCLRSLTMIVRPKGDATPTRNAFAADIVFSKTNTVSLGTVGAALDHRPNPDIIGIIEITSGSYGTNSFQSTAIATTSIGSDEEHATAPLVLEGDPTSGDNVGYDTVYVGIAARAAFDFTSINVINDADINSTTPTAIVMGGGGMDVREHFAVGDVLHAQDDILLGTVASIDGATTGPINLTSATSGAGDATTVANGDTIYNLHPITLVLGLEK